MTTQAPPVPLESGDHLTRQEFHRRYCARPDIKKAELVEGVVFVASPVRLGLHGEPHAAIMGWLFAYVATHPDVRIGDNATVLLEGENEVQPDAFLLRSQAHENEQGYVEGAPELVVEIAASSASYDLFEKKRVYLRSGVREYIVWQTDDKRLDWFRLTDGNYVEVQPGTDGVIESASFPGLRLNVPALLRGDFKAVLES